MRLYNLILASVAFLLVAQFNDNRVDGKSVAISGPVETECLMYSDVFFEYMYAANFMFSKFFKRTVYTWSPVHFWSGSRFDVNFQFTTSEPKAVWFFERVEGRPGVYYLRNLKYKEYLYASQYHAGLFAPQRLVYTNNRIKPEWHESYMWRVEKEAGGKDRYTIWNVKYNEPMYPALQKDQQDNVPDSRRGVYTWPLKSDQPPASFYWTLKCKDNKIPASV